MNRDMMIVLVTTSGEHILAERVEYDNRADYADDFKKDDCIVVKNPVQLAPSPDPSKQGQLIFLPYLQLTELTVVPFPRYDIRHVLTEVKEDLINVYSKIHGGGIQVPNKEIILG